MKKWRILLSLFLFVTVANSHAASLSIFNISNKNSPTAIVLIGGLDKGYQSLKDWAPLLVNSDASVYGFDDNFRSTSLRDSSWRLAVSLSILANEGKTRLIIIAYSMGGLVAKHALHRMDWQGTLSGFKKVELHAMGSPWGGSFFANILPYLPFNSQVLDQIGYLMVQDIGSESEFMKTLENPLPSNVRFHLYEGAKDTVAKATNRNTKSRYESIAALASSRILFKDATHNDFMKPYMIPFDYQ